MKLKARFNKEDKGFSFDLWNDSTDKIIVALFLSFNNGVSFTLVLGQLFIFELKYIYKRFFRCSSGIPMYSKNLFTIYKDTLN